jgi:NitT/TauT family transport system ATP-binding protein
MDAVTRAERAGSSNFIHVQQVNKIYETSSGPVEAVSGATFAVAKGQFVAILGPSGCGKSTLLMMCGGLESITSGKIDVAGVPMTKPRTNIGVIFQDPTLLAWKSVCDNILFPVKILKLPRHQYEDRVRSLIDLVGLQGFADKRPRELSGGMRQRVAICRALVYDPDVLLMDEPFSALDAITRDEMNEVLLDIWQQYTKTALFVTHSIREAVLLADRVLVMSRRPGKVVEDLVVPFARPRSIEISETPEFSALCAHLRRVIESGHSSRRTTQTAVAMQR